MGEQTIDSQRMLVEAAQGGDIDSFGRLCTRYYAPLTAVAYNVLGDHQLAEDAAQEAFARGLVNLRKLKKPDKFAPWLAQICRNVAIDMARARARDVRAQDLSHGQDDRDDDPAIPVVRRAIEDLAPALKEVVILRYYNSSSYEQISAVLGLSKMTINGRLTRAKRKLLRVLEQNGLSENFS
jgi:RNA polymerase sigma-70 factor (ECF subfamily)